MTSEVEVVEHPVDLGEEKIEEASLEANFVEEQPTEFPRPRAKPVNPLVVSKRWKEYIDSATNRPYYFDRLTKGVQWRKPAGFLTRKELLRPVSVNQIGASDWKVVSTLCGRDYFFHMSTGQVAWELPEDFNTPIHVKAPIAEVEGSLLNDKKRLLDDRIEDEAPEPKRRKMLASESSRPATFVGMFEDTRDTVISNYKSMLESYGVDKDALWSDWSKKLAKDGRFNAVASLVERRSLFESYVRQLALEHKQRRKKDMEDAKEALWKEIQKVQEKNWRGFDAFKDQFRPTEAYQNLRDLHPDSIGDIYDDVIRLESETRKKEKERAKRDFMDMLEELIRDRYEKDTKKDWLDFKLELESDPRYNRALLTGTERENLFEDFASEIRHSLAPKSRESHKRYEEKDYRDEGFRSERNKREEALARRNEDASRQRHREEHFVREKHERTREDREIQGFKTLLAERVLRANLEWESVEPSLSRDPRFDTPYIGNKGKMRLFEGHIMELQRNAERMFFKTLDSYGSGDFYQSWQEASDSLLRTPAFSIMTTNAEREKAYKRWAMENKNRAESNLHQLFQSTPLITSDTDLENKKELNPILEVLKKDVRWRALPESSVGWTARRMELLTEFVDTLPSKSQK
jgi:hypothetical protein